MVIFPSLSTSANFFCASVKFGVPPALMLEYASSAWYASSMEITPSPSRSPISVVGCSGSVVVVVVVVVVEVVVVVVAVPVVVVPVVVVVSVLGSVAVSVAVGLVAVVVVVVVVVVVSVVVVVVTGGVLELSSATKGIFCSFAYVSA